MLCCLLSLFPSFFFLFLLLFETELFEARSFHTRSLERCCVTAGTVRVTLTAFTRATRNQGIEVGQQENNFGSLERNKNESNVPFGGRLWEIGQLNAVCRKEDVIDVNHAGLIGYNLIAHPSGKAGGWWWSNKRGAMCHSKDLNKGHCA